MGERKKNICKNSELTMSPTQRILSHIFREACNCDALLCGQRVADSTGAVVQ